MVHGMHCMVAVSNVVLWGGSFWHEKEALVGAFCVWKNANEAHLPQFVEFFELFEFAGR